MRWIRIVVDSATELRRVLLHPGAEARVRRVQITVADWRPPRPGWSGRLGPLPGLRSQEVRLPRRGGRGRARVRIVLSEPASLREVLSAALPVLWPGPPAIGFEAAGPGSELRASGLVAIEPLETLTLPAGQSEPTELPGLTALSGLTDPAPVGTKPAAAGSSGTGLPGTGLSGTGLSATEGDPDTGHAVQVPPSVPPPGFDLGLLNPVGRSADYGPACPQGRLELADGRWRVVSCDGGQGDPPRVLIDWRTFPELDDYAQGVARELNVLHGDYVPVEDPELAARLVALFAAMGVVCHWPALPPTAAELLGGELWTLVSSTLPEATAGPAAWESVSVAQRRAAMRDHGREYVMHGGLADVTAQPLRQPPVSALLVISDPASLPARPAGSLEAGSLPAVLRQIQDQTYARLELVVGVRGGLPAAAVPDGIPGSRVPYRVHTFPSSYSPGEVLAATANRAAGSLLTIFDTGNDYGTEHVWDLVLARAYSGATLVGKPAEFTHLEPLDLTVRQSRGPAERYTDRVADGAMLIGRADLEGDHAGRPAPYPLDTGLPGRVLRDGGLVYVTHGLGFLVRRNSTATSHRNAPGIDAVTR